ncbi:hypothetical protein B0H10DRAFT_2298764 [Mycena sp. CBHHK59/15]|nr:hypothetical protein B0H10DRAFT_2298764 [Mycena sp. CBHHK59/15]
MCIRIWKADHGPGGGGGLWFQGPDGRFWSPLVVTVQFSDPNGPEIHDRANKKTSRGKAAASTGGSTITSGKQCRASIGSADGSPATRQRLDHDGLPSQADVDQEDGDSDDEDMLRDNTVETVELFPNAETFCEALRAEFKAKSAVDFHGAYAVPVDPLVSPRQRIIGSARTGIKPHYYCSQNEACKKKSKVSQNPDICNQDNVSMKCYPCGSSLRISCTPAKDEEEDDQLMVEVKLKHAGHISYVDVLMPPGALDIVWENVQWLTPVAMVSKVQASFLNITAAQIHRAWTEMSEVYWRQDDVQLPSAEKLLEEYGEDVDIFKLVDIPEGVEILCWGMMKIAELLKGQINFLIKNSG